MSARYEITQTDAGWTARHVVNGKVIMSSGSQVYARRAGAVRAVELNARGAILRRDGQYLPYVQTSNGPIEVRFLDERSKAVA